MNAINKIAGPTDFEKALTYEIQQAAEKNRQPAIIFLQPQDQELTDRVCESLVNLAYANVNFLPGKKQCLDFVAKYDENYAAIMINQNGQEAKTIMNNILGQLQSQIGSLKMEHTGVAVYEHGKTSEQMIKEVLGK
ncbi:MAG: hypothetical protein Q8O89_04475 [Nanoarchaeota archaeon]|nr:hypothetical protein [Nanoarchaeota archaeon]